MLTEEGPGFPFFLPKGMVLKNTLIDYWRRDATSATAMWRSPPPSSSTASLWERSGHWDHYKNNMYTTVIDDEDFAIKPMNCPGGMLVYKSEPHSYRDLPLRVGELGLVHRHELSGALHGLFRVRCFTQDDAHIFMTRDQMKDEIKNVVAPVRRGVLHLRPDVSRSSSPPCRRTTWATRRTGSSPTRRPARRPSTEMGKDYVINEGDGAFYGPKLDFHLADSLGRTWQCGTIQLDFQLPERFELEYIGRGRREAPPGHDPPRGAGLHRAVHRRHHRALCRRLPHLAGPGAGQGAAHHRPCRTTTPKQVADRAGQAEGLRVRDWTAAARRSATRSGRPSWRRCPICWCWATRKPEAGQVAVRNRKDGKTEVMGLDEFLAKIREEVDTKAL